MKNNCYVNLFGRYNLVTATTILIPRNPDHDVFDKSPGQLVKMCGAICGDTSEVRT